MAHFVYTVGCGQCGQQGMGYDNIVVIKKLSTIPADVQIQLIESGWYGSTYILTKNGDLIVFGHNTLCELGLKSYDQCIHFIIDHWYKLKTIPVSLIDEIIKYSSPLIEINNNQCYPVKISNLKPKYISSGSLAPHRFIITKNDEIYGCGQNTSSQILPIPDDELSYSANISKWTKINYFTKNHITVKQISCSKTYSIFLTIDGLMYSRGTSYDGGLGFGADINILTTITHISSVAVKIKQIACGYYHTLAVCCFGNAVSFGRNTYGELGYKDDDNTDKAPIIVPYFHENNILIQQVGCGQHNNIARDSKGNVYCFGFNGEYQCGIDNSDNKLGCIYTPTIVKIDRMKQVKIVDVKSGSDHVMATSIDNQYWLWGLNNWNQCLVFNGDRYVKIPTKYHGVGLDVDCVIVDIYLGDTATRIVTKRDQQYITH